MIFKEQNIKGVWVIEPRVFTDERGYFMESFKQSEFEKNIGKIQFIQDNESKSTKGVLRGLHYQKGDASQAKLVRVIKGSVLDVVVDLRKESPTLGRYLSVELSEDNKKQLFVPRGFAHGFIVLSDVTVFTYKVDNVYSPENEATLLWDDPKLCIDWQIEKQNIILSAKDKQGKPLSESFLF